MPQCLGWATTAHIPTEPPACYRASWQLPGPDSHRQAQWHAYAKYHQMIPWNRSFTRAQQEV
jgi:hypothetical protein